MDTEKEELEKHGIELEIMNARYAMFLEYKDMLKYLNYPPITLKSNLKKFNNDVLKASQLISEKKEYDESLFGRIRTKWSKQLTEAEKFSKNWKASSRSAAEEYVKKNPSVSLSDFDERSIR
jgi:hypothetical protein